MTLLLYTVRNQEGKFFRKRGYGGMGEQWVGDLNRATLYSKAGTARRQITWWYKHYPEYGCPDLMVIEGEIKGIYHEQERVDDVQEKQRKREIRRNKKEIERKYKAVKDEYDKMFA